MRRILKPVLFSLIMIAGLFIGIIKGPDVRNKWVSKMKFKHEDFKQQARIQPGEIALDEIELSTYHS